MIGLIIIPYSFTNGTEVADGVKVNSNFSVLATVVNELITDSNNLAGDRDSLIDRLNVSLNADGTLKASALPVGTYDTRTVRTITDDDVVTEDDSVILVDTTAKDIVLTLPPHDSAAVMPTIVNVGKTGYVATLNPDGTDTIMEQSEYVLSMAGEYAQFAVAGTNWWRVR